MSHYRADEAASKIQAVARGRRDRRAVEAQIEEDYRRLVQRPVEFSAVLQQPPPLPSDFNTAYDGSEGRLQPGEKLSPGRGGRTARTPRQSAGRSPGRTGSHASGSGSRGEGSVFDKLNDSTHFTGAHKHRFNRDGTGRGLAGRDRVFKGSGSLGHAPVAVVDTVVHDISQLFRPHLTFDRTRLDGRSPTEKRAERGIARHLRNAERQWRAQGTVSSPRSPGSRGGSPPANSTAGSVAPRVHATGRTRSAARRAKHARAQQGAARANRRRGSPDSSSAEQICASAFELNEVRHIESIVL